MTVAAEVPPNFGAMYMKHLFFAVLVVNSYWPINWPHADHDLVEFFVIMISLGQNFFISL